MKLSAQGRVFLTDYEKREPKAYKDSAGLWTIGIGHLITRDEKALGKVKIGDESVEWRTATLTDEQMDTLFAQDLAPREAALTGLLRSDPTQQQFDAMFCLLYNIGGSGFRTSTVLRKFSLGDIQGAAKAFMMWVKVKSQVSRGLVKRRTQEKAMFLNGDYTSEH